jgi:hypothetical protein
MECDGAVGQLIFCLGACLRRDSKSRSVSRIDCDFWLKEPM